MNKKYAVLFAVLMLSLTFSGVAYAHWYKIIKFEGKINTGVLHLTPTLQYYDLVQCHGKPVAYWGDDFDGCGIVDNRVYFSLWNVYPCLDAHLKLSIQNDGTIPAGYKEFRTMYAEYWVPDDPGTTGVDESGWFPVPESAYDIEETQIPDSDGDGVPEGYAFTIWKETGVTRDPYWDKVATVTVDLTKTAPNPQLSPDYPHSWIQIDPGQWVYADIYMHFYEGLPQGETLRFGFEIEYWNWNEVFCQAS